MEQLDAAVKDGGLQIKSSGEFGITFQKSERLTACILKSGIMIAQTPPQLEDDLKDEVAETYRSILIDGLGLPDDILPNTD